MDKNQPLVSIITPCYNGGRFVNRLLESVISQTYNNIELLLIDDGSTDNTKDVVFSYVAKFKELGMNLIYLYQENQGQAEAINKGLANMSGDYLTWIDSDDFLMVESVEKRVKLLEDNGKGYFCITVGDLVCEDDVDKTIRKIQRMQPEGKDNFFMDLIHVSNVVFASGGGFMVHASDFIKAVPTNRIYNSREGQNWQLMLPITYFYKCLYIEESLYKVVETSNSHSRGNRTIERTIDRKKNLMLLICETVKAMNIKEEEEVVQFIIEKYSWQIIELLKYTNSRVEYIGKKKEYIKNFGYGPYIKRYVQNLIKNIAMTIKNNSIIRKICGKNAIVKTNAFDNRKR
ncbi:MAG: glycosyltransferase family 2 protein [Eubacteriales bacterium]